MCIESQQIGFDCFWGWGYYYYYYHYHYYYFEQQATATMPEGLAMVNRIPTHPTMQLTNAQLSSWTVESAAGEDEPVVVVVSLLITVALIYPNLNALQLIIVRRTFRALNLQPHTVTHCTCYCVYLNRIHLLWRICAGQTKIAYPWHVGRLWM